MPATLFLVATPIGNLEDMTFRAIRVLREVALIAAEDTRHTAKLLSHFDIRTPTISVYEQNERERVPQLLERLLAGESLALVSDAGTPVVSDPGYRLVTAAIEAGIRVESVPGPSAVLTALVASGLPSDRFTFVGFPPPKAQARERWFAELADRTETLLFFEAPHRIRETLESLLKSLGNRQVVVARELTKIHEELLRGPVSDVLSRLGNPRGEFTVVVGPLAETAAAAEGTSEPNVTLDPAAILARFRQLTENGATRREALTALAHQHGVSTRAIYAAIERAKGAIAR